MRSYLYLKLYSNHNNVCGHFEQLANLEILKLDRFSPKVCFLKCISYYLKQQIIVILGVGGGGVI